MGKIEAPILWRTAHLPVFARLLLAVIIVPGLGGGLINGILALASVSLSQFIIWSAAAMMTQAV